VNREDDTSRHVRVSHLLVYIMLRSEDIDR